MPATFLMTLNSQEIAQLTLTYTDAQGKQHTKSYSVFSGAGKDRNNPASTDKADAGPLPQGKYYVVDRESGGRLGWLRDKWSGKDVWFALYRDDGSVDDFTFINGVQRGIRRAEFDEMREILLSMPTASIPGGSTQYYAILTVH